MKLREKEFKIFCFLRNITDESEREQTKANKFELYRDSGSWNEMMNTVDKIESETNDTVKIEGTTVEIYGSIDPPIIVSDVEMNKKQALFEALFQYVQKRW